MSWRLVACHLASSQVTSDGVARVVCHAVALVVCHAVARVVCHAVALVVCHATDATHVHVPPSNNIIRFVFSHHPHLACLDPVSVDLLRVDPL